MFGVGLRLSGVAGCLLSMTCHDLAEHGEFPIQIALIVIAGRFRQHTGGALVGGRAGRHRGGRHAFHQPVAGKALLSYGMFVAVLLWRPNGLFTRK